MSMRSIFSRALLAGMALGGLACGPTVEANETATQEQEARGGSGQFCGGIAAIRCPEGYTCVDDPNDDCDPNQGGADCAGICVKDKGNQCTGREPGLKYISRDPNQCATIRFFCEQGYQPFFNDCGCGCEPIR